MLQIAASCEQVSEHPLGQAIVEAAKEKGMELYKVEDFQSLTGKGIRAKIAGKQYDIGNRRLLEEMGIVLGEYEEEAKAIAGKGQTPMYLAEEQKILGIISVADPIKDTSKEAVQKIRDLGIQVYMLTGDNRLTAEYIGGQVGVDKVISEVLPKDKASAAIGSGSDIAIDSGDLVLMKSDLNDVYKAIALSHATIRNIKQNLFWAFFYNSLGIPLAAGALYAINGTLLNPIFAGLAMSLSSVTVVGNALRLRKLKL